MTTTIKTKTTIIKAIMLLLVMNLAFACSETKTPSTDATTQTAANTQTAATEKNVAPITITGIVKQITFGKDGYTADVQTEKEGLYAALVSSANMGGPDKYKSCAVGDKVTFKGRPWAMGDAKQLTVEEIISIGKSSTDTQLWITEIGFRGIQVGDAIANHGAYTKKTKLKTGEGSFDVYEIRDFENNPAGYFEPDPKNKLLVGDITVESPKATTNEGLKIGDSFQALSKIFPLAEVHGSEVEGRTYAHTGKIAYRLDMPNFKYDVDKAKIPAATKITQIIIERGDVESTNTQTPNVAALATQYGAIKPHDFCWQTNKALDLHTKPASDSKVEGKHFMGQGLSVLGTKTINNQLWVHVTYSLTIKGGYEGRFPNNRIAPGGVLTGWIGGAETPEIRCK